MSPGEIALEGVFLGLAVLLAIALLVLIGVCIWSCRVCCEINKTKRQREQQQALIQAGAGEGDTQQGAGRRVYKEGLLGRDVHDLIQCSVGSKLKLR